MIIYKYLFKNGKLERTIQEEFVTEEIINILKSRNVNSDTLYNAYISYQEGLSNSNIIALENKWYNSYVSGDTKTYLGLEERFPYLKGFRGLKTSFKRKLVKVNNIDKETTKEIIRYERDRKVRDYEDSIADLAKLVSFSYSIQRAIYSTLSETAKNKIPSEIRTFIEYALEKFGGVNTRADRQLKEEGIKLIDRLLNAEEEIADIVDKVKSNKKES